jgi:hypothetical protein
VRLFWWDDARPPKEKVEGMANLLAVGVAALLAIVMVIAYALVLRELQKINANLEQFIKLVLDLRRRDDPQEANEILHKGSSSYRGFPPR